MDIYPPACFKPLQRTVNSWTSESRLSDSPGGTWTYATLTSDFGATTTTSVVQGVTTPASSRVQPRASGRPPAPTQACGVLMKNERAGPEPAPAEDD